MKDFISIRGAAEHNLKNISVDIPLGCITVIRGDSGSGKSTLAFDVLYTEAKRRYLGAISEDWMNIYHPRVKIVEPALASIALQQHCYNRNPRSTVGTFTGLIDVLKGVFELAGEAFCNKCGTKINVKTPEQACSELMDLPDGTRIIIKSPVDSEEDPGIRTVLQQYISNGFVRCMVDGSICYLDDLLGRNDDLLSKKISIVVDRIIKKAGIRDRVIDSLKQALSLSGVAEVDLILKGTSTDSAACDSVVFSDTPVCINCMSGKQADVSRNTGNDEGLPFSFTENFILKIDGHDIDQIMSFAMQELGEKLLAWQKDWSINRRREYQAAAMAAYEMYRGVSTFLSMGLGYLSLNRSIPTLSTGELLKLRLGSVLTRKMSGILYVLDEPLGGLSDNEKAVVRDKIGLLRDSGNTLVVVEQDMDLVRNLADYVIELGPAAGEFGGELIYQGPADDYVNDREVISRPASISGSKSMELLRVAGNKGQEGMRFDQFVNFQIEGARRPLKSISVRFPAGVLTGITGPSGSGKSLLLNAIVTCSKSDRTVTKEEQGQDSIKPCSDIFQQNVLFMDDALPRGSRSSMVATYSRVYSHIAHLFARTPAARARGISSGYLSLSKKGGRCDKCKGTGVLTMEPKFLPPVTFTCHACSGRRFSEQVLSVKYKGIDMCEVLSTTVSQAATFFRNIQKIRQPLEALERSGLGYLQLGQQISSLSGGERQRLKLATVLSGRSIKKPSLFILDNPARGLSSRDISRLCSLLYDLVSEGHTIIMAENNRQVLEHCGWIIEMGPGSGPDGGEIVYQGPA